MRKIFFSLIFSALAWGQVEAASPMTDVGASYSTMTTIFVTTTPMLVVSTGTNNPCVGSSNWLQASSPGQYLCDRIYLSIQNNSGVSLWLGVTQNVSSQAVQTNANYGTLIGTGTTFETNDRHPFYWIMSSTTAYPVTVTQKR